MFFVDAATSDWARHLPHWLDDVGRRDHQSRAVRRFLYPLGFHPRDFAAIVTPYVAAMTQGMLASLAVRFGFLFRRDRAAEPVRTVVKRLIGRARPMWAPTTILSCICRSSGGPNTPACRQVTRQQPRRRPIAIGAIWPRVRAGDVALRADHHAQPHARTCHHPSDVLGGALVGVVGALSCAAGFGARLGFSPGICGLMPGRHGQVEGDRTRDCGRRAGPLERCRPVHLVSTSSL